GRCQTGHLASGIRTRIGEGAEGGPVSTNGFPAIETHDLVMRFPAQQGWQSLFKREPGKTALRGINLTIPNGEISGLLGPNGAGKTTLVKIISTLTIPSEGTARVTGLDVVKNSIDVRRKVGVVYGDERTLYWRLSGLDNLLFYAALYGIPPKQARKRALELLELVGLSEAADVRVHHYSSGMKQRASIARGLLNDPEILVMDEPTRSLDPMAARELRTLVKDRVVNDQRTVLVATNIMAEAEYLCDRIAFINHGEIQMTGEIDYLRDLLESEEQYQVVVSGFSFQLVELLRQIDGVHSVKAASVRDDLYRLDVVVDGESTAIPNLIRRIVAEDASVWSCGRRQLTLEEMFALVMAKSRHPEDKEMVVA
ncbi:MAG: ABC transporter ATP-binding protein, partial [Dehalococcoidia bacterium]